jgi:hypothetical protein
MSIRVRILFNVGYLMSMKELFIFMVLLLSMEVQADELRALVRIDKSDEEVQIFRLEKGDHIPTIPSTKEIKTRLLGLKDGTEAVMKGHLTYEMMGGNESRQLRPYFVIDEIHPVSLSELGTAAGKVESKSFVPKEISYYTYTEPKLVVSTEVASAITLTTSLLLMEELTAGSGDTSARRDMRRALFLSTGGMATLLFIYDQFRGNTKP